MPATSFTEIFIETLNEFVKILKDFNNENEDKITNACMECLGDVSFRFCAKIQQKQAVFNISDLPCLLFIAWIASGMLKNIKNKTKSKKRFVGILRDCLWKAAQEKHDAKILFNNVISVTPLYISRNGIVDCLNYISNYPEGNDAYGEIVLENIYDFFQVVLKDYMGKQFNGQENNDGLAAIGIDAYVTEWPRRVCPNCFRQAWPVPEISEPINKSDGFLFKCVFCGHAFGYGGLRKAIVRHGKRIASTSWTTDKFAVDACQFCGMPKAMANKKGAHLEAHHIVPVSEGGEDIPSNIMILCSWCHKEAHERRRFWQKFAR